MSSVITFNFTEFAQFIEAEINQFAFQGFDPIAFKSYLAALLNSPEVRKMIMTEINARRTNADTIEEYINNDILGRSLVIFHTRGNKVKSTRKDQFDEKGRECLVRLAAILKIRLVGKPTKATDITFARLAASYAAESALMLESFPQLRVVGGIIPGLPRAFHTPASASLIPFDAARLWTKFLDFNNNFALEINKNDKHTTDEKISSSQAFATTARNSNLYNTAERKAFLLMLVTAVEKAYRKTYAQEYKEYICQIAQTLFDIPEMRSFFETHKPDGKPTKFAVPTQYASIAGWFSDSSKLVEFNDNVKVGRALGFEEQESRGVKEEAENVAAGNWFAKDEVAKKILH